MKRNSLLILLLIITSFSSGYFYFKAQANTKGATTTNSETPSILKPNPNEHWNGTKNARYVWVEFSDLQCPYCQSIHPNLTKLLNTYSGKIAWVYRHFPLPSHPKAQPAAEATECLNEQKGNEAFWKMTNTIFEKMPDIEVEEFTTIAVQLGADEQKFKTCVDSKKYEKKVKDQFNEGNNAGVNSTPTSFIYDLKSGNQVKVIGALAFEDLRKSLDNFISENK